VTQHPIRRLLANACNRGTVCINDALYAKALVELLGELERRVDELPSWARRLVEKVKEKGERV